MKSKTKRTLIIAALGASVAIPAGAITLQLGYADEYTLGWVDCTTDTGRCTYNNIYGGRTSSGPNEDAPQTWDYIGMQTIGGRANSRSKAMFRWEQLAGNTCGTATASITRWKLVSGYVYLGAPCTTGSQSQVAVSSQTFYDCTAGEGKIQQRLLPILDYTSETAGAGDILYREDLGISSQFASGYSSGCFKIKWQ